MGEAAEHGVELLLVERERERVVGQRSNADLAFGEHAAEIVGVVADATAAEQALFDGVGRRGVVVGVGDFGGAVVGGLQIIEGEKPCRRECNTLDLEGL